MASLKAPFCNLCEQNDTTIAADVWCYECHEFLCYECRKHHSVSKWTKKHSTISVDDYKQVPEVVRSIKLICGDHDELFDSFCATHDIPCCKRCLILTHKDCPDLTIIEDILQTTEISKSSTAFEKIEKGIAGAKANIKTIKDDRQRCKSNILEQENKVRQDISKMRKSVSALMDTIEENILTEMSNIIAKEVEEIDNTTAEVLEIESQLSNIDKDASDIKKHASDLQSVLGVRQLESTLAAARKSIEVAKSKGKLDNSNIEFDFRPIISALNGIEVSHIISSSKTPSGIEFVDYESPQAQIVSIPPRSIQNISGKLNKHLKFEEQTRFNFVCGCSFMEDGAILICEFNSGRYEDRLVVIDKSEHTKSVQFPGQEISVFDVTRINNDKIAITSRSEKIVIFDAKDFRLLRRVKVSGKVSGIAANNCTVYFCNQNKGIQSIDLDENRDSCVVTDILSFQAIAYSFLDYLKDRLYYTINETSIGCCDLNGTEIWTLIEDNSILRQPRGISVDRYGNVFVVGGHSNNVIVVSPDGSEYTEVIDDEDGLSAPRAISYDEVHHRLLICNHQKDAFIYDIVHM